MEETYDNFNMLIMPHKVDNQKLFFEENQHKRRIPTGIIPNPNHKRIPHRLATRLQAQTTSKSDRFTTFEASPHADMIKRENEVSRTLKPITDDVSMICNLQNVKQGLKSDFNDVQIAQTILLNLDFTDQLIREHLDNLSGKSLNTNAPKFVPRNASAFREFTEKSAPCSNNSSFQSQFSHFYMKDALQTTKAQALYDQIQDKLAQDPDANIDDLQREMDDILLARDRAYEDNFSLSHALENKSKITSDISSLTHNAKNTTRGVREDQMSDQDFLSYNRRVSEATLIKSKIVYKVNKDLPLTKNETEYLQKWTQEASQSKESLLGHQSMIPSESSSKRVDSLKAEDFYTLNQINGVEFTREKHGAYALNDLVVELSHFLDKDLVRNVELTCLEDKLKKEWQLGGEFRLVDKMNKESVLVMQELEETAWKEAGKFNDSDLKNIKEVISVKRNSHDKFDQAFYDLDMQSLEEFIQKINSSEDRIDLMENWIVRKEQEITSRVNLPSPDLQVSDQALFDQIDAPLKKARQKLASQLLTHDERGNAIAVKPYSQMTTHELHLLSENLSVRLNMFYSSKRGPSERYPAYLPQVIKAIMEHPNLANSDKNLLDTYCYLFELDWRGDREMRNQDQFMATHPVYVEGHEQNSQKPALDNLRANQMLHNASLPFLPSLTSKMYALAQKSE